MGYETRVFICDTPCSALNMKEIEHDMSKPYKDGSGYEYKKDAKGNTVYTGRIEKHLIVIASLDLCKAGSDNAFGKLLDSKPDKKYEDCAEFYCIYGSDGNTLMHTDCYGVLMKDFSVAKMLKAAKEAYKQTGYRRFQWLAAMLEPMSKVKKEKFICLTYGH